MGALAYHVHVTDDQRGLAETAVRSIRSGSPLVATDPETGAAVELDGAILATVLEVLSRALESDECILVHREAELTPEQAAKVLGISRPMVYHRMDRGRLPFRKVGSHRRVALRDVLALEDHEVERREFSEAMGQDMDAQEPAFGSRI